ncbi:unnamed protein product [Symbiodinium microadriaticum]|nr:unnamed protein product [Symbiodinium microadriaticum]
MTHLQAAQQTGSGADAEKAKKYFQETEDLYKQAIDLDPQGMEAMVQFAQLKTMLGDMQGSLDLSVRALPLSRSRDEALEVLHIKIMTEAQMVAVGIIQAMGAQTGA